MRALLKLIPLPYGVKYCLCFGVNFDFVAPQLRLLPLLPPSQCRRTLELLAFVLHHAVGSMPSDPTGKFTNV